MSTTTPIRRSLGRASAVAAAALLGLGLAPGPAAADDAAAVTGGTLDWGVKESFRNYVTGPIGGGEITVLDGAVLNSDGTFRFVDATGTLTGDDAAVSFDGAVRFEAHHGALDLTIEAITVDTAAGTLVADVTSKDMGSGEYVEYPGVVLADLDDSGAARSTDGDTTTIADIAATLGTDGADAFGGFYGAGTALDPATVAVSVGDDAPAPSTGEVSDGTLDWGVKESFRNYVVGPIAGGGIEIGDGAETNDDGTFRFTGATGDLADGDVALAFDGSVRFYGHDHGDGTYELDLTLTDLRLEGSGDTASLVTGDVAVATVDLGEGFAVADGVASLVDAPVTLTAAGAEYFGGFYAEGTTLDPLTVHVALSDDATLPGTPGGPGAPAGPGGPSLAKTGVSLSAMLAGGAGLLVVGGGALWLTRRRLTAAA